jgi:hypothetical protein
MKKHNNAIMFISILYQSVKTIVEYQQIVTSQIVNGTINIFIRNISENNNQHSLFLIIDYNRSYT